MVSLRISNRKPHEFLALFAMLAAAIGFPAKALTEERPTRELCKNFIVIGDFGGRLSDVEKRLVCGDPEGPHGWRKIPASQARFNFQNFLQERGFFRTKFTREGEKVIVDVGEPTVVKGLATQGAPPDFDIGRKRKKVGETLTPKLIDEAEQWVEQRLQAEGYACPQVNGRADPNTGEMVIDVEPGSRLSLIAIEEESVPGVAPQTLRRHDAFRLGETFNGDGFTVTENRITSLDIVQSIHFAFRCEPNGVVATQKTVAGAPRLLSAGIGFNTEEGPLLRTSWRNSRLGLRASWLEVTARGSYRRQSLTGILNWYHLDHPSRRSLRPLAEVRHTNEPDNRTLSARAQFAFHSSWDGQDVGATFFSGPTLDLYRRLRGVGQPNAKFLSLESGLTVQSHSYELYLGSPRSGYFANLTLGLSEQALLSTVSAQRVELQGKGLWNLGHFDPPLLVAGLRGGVATTLSGERPGPATRLPAPLLHYLGGSQNIRGFGRRELPNDEGAMTTAYVSSELRLTHVLPWDFQPLLLMDAGMLSRDPFSLSRTLFWSPGVGLRLESPFGVFRTTLARGFGKEGPPGWQFFLSYGEEF